MSLAKSRPTHWLWLISLGAVLGGACEQTVYRSHESHFCSNTKDDDPYYECARSSNLVCINTYQMSYPVADGKPPVIRDMWLCRLACTPGDPKNGCSTSEVCCPGPIFGRDYGMKHACVPPNFCPALAVPSTPRDGGGGDVRLIPEAGAIEAGPSEAGADAGDAGDGGAGGEVSSDETGGDAGASPDVIDAPMDLGGTD